MQFTGRDMASSPPSKEHGVLLLKSASRLHSDVAHTLLGAWEWTYKGSLQCPCEQDLSLLAQGHSTCRREGEREGEIPPTPNLYLFRGPHPFRVEGTMLWPRCPCAQAGKLGRAVRKGALGFVLVYENHLLCKYYLSGAEILFQKKLLAIFS